MFIVMFFCLILYGTFNSFMLYRLRASGVKVKTKITDIWYGGTKGGSNEGYIYEYYARNKFHDFHTFTRNGMLIHDSITIYHDPYLVWYSRDSITVATSSW
jgi:hypothetical protein